MTAEPLLEVAGLTVRFSSPRRRPARAAVREMALTIRAGEAVGLVGGSGAGKTTVARALAGLIRPEPNSSIRFAGRELVGARAADARRWRRAMHLVMQDPYASLPPHYRVAAIVAEPLVIHRSVAHRSRERRVSAVFQALEQVRLPPARYADRYPHQLSGGERQRVALARALITEPALVVADEPTQMLDPSLRGELVDLIDDVRRSRGMAVLHITHDLALAQRGCDRLVVLRAGEVIEQGPTDQVLANPRHPYTAALVAAAHPGGFAGTPGMDR